MFYEIPKDGTTSHKTLVDQSTDYIGNFIDDRDNEILDLTQKLVKKLINKLKNLIFRN